MMTERLEKLLRRAEETRSREDIDNLEKELTFDYDEHLMDELDSIIPDQIIFVQGPHRSGTTILTELLQKTGLNALDLYQIISYNQLIYNHINGREEIAREALDLIFEVRGAETREYDDIKINSNTVEEYCHLIARPPNLLERISPAIYALDYEGVHRLDRKNIDKLREITKKMRYISGNDHPIVLKNPFDFTKSRFIHKHFPDSKQVFLRRNPERTIASLYKALAKDYEGESPVPYLDMINDFYHRTFNDPIVRRVVNKVSKEGWSVPILIKRAANEVRQFRAEIRFLDNDMYMETNYQQICEKTEEVVKSILDLAGSDLNVPNLSQYIERRHSSLPTPVMQRQDIITDSFPREYYDMAGDY